MPPKTAAHTSTMTQARIPIAYIATGKAVPEGFAPSSILWVDMLNAKGTTTETISESRGSVNAAKDCGAYKYDDTG